MRGRRSEEHTSELQSLRHLVCRLLLEKTKTILHGEHAVSCGPDVHYFFVIVRCVCAVWRESRLLRETRPLEPRPRQVVLFFFNDSPAPEIYPLSLPAALPI